MTTLPFFLCQGVLQARPSARMAAVAFRRGSSLDAARLIDAHRLVERGGIAGKVVVARAKEDMARPVPVARQHGLAAPTSVAGPHRATSPESQEEARS
jgi:hypothetical protein